MNSFTIGYVCFQAVVLLVVLGILWRKKGWYADTNTAASILTIVGVLGTFIGIFAGLQEFTTDSAKMQESISKLLEGLKFAFGTSIVGIGSALLLKGIISPLAKTFQKGKVPSEVERNEFIEDLKGIETSGETNLLAQLVTLNTTIKDGQIRIVEQLQTLTSTVSDKHNQVITTQKEEGTQTRDKLNEATTALTDIQSTLNEGQNATVAKLEALTTTVSDKHDQLRDEFQTFSKTVAESVAKLATDELIEALKTVIEDFNAKLTEQFGENFKQLNEAVGKTVAWQEQYRQQMDELADEFRVAAKSIEQSRVSMEQIARASSEIADRSHSIVVCAEDMEPLLHTLNDQLEAFRELRDQAHEAFPLIENRLNDLTTNFSTAVQRAINNSHVSMETQRRELKEQTDKLEETVTHIAIELKNLVERNKEDIENHVNTLHGELRKEVNTLNESLREELTNSLQTLAGYIERLSKGFVNNYTELVESYTQALDVLRQIIDAVPQSRLR